MGTIGMELTMVRSWRRFARSGALLVSFLSGVARADSNCTSPDGQGGTFFITSQADADALNNCSTVTGDIVIQSSGSGLAQITLNGIETIEGNLATSSCDGLQKIEAPVLSQIAHNFTLSSLPLLSSLDFPLLDNVHGGIYWDTLPSLTDVSFGNLTASSYGLPGTNVDGDISISSTGLSSLGFLNFTHYSEPALIWIKDNQQLNNINLTGLSWGSDSLIIVNNGPAALVSLPSLRSAGTITIGNAVHIEIPSLSETGSSLEISNNSIDAFTASNLTAIGGNFIVRNNYLLDDLSLPLLTSIGSGPGDWDFVVENNTALTEIIHMNQLWYAQGNIDLSGNLSNVSLPNLRSIVGGFHLNSSNPALDCTAFDKLSYQTKWTPPFYSCAAHVPGDNADLATHYHPPKTGDIDISKSARAIIIIVSTIAGILLCALMARWVGRRKARRAPHAEEGTQLGELGTSDPGIEASQGDAFSQRDRSPEGETPPKYRVVGKPGEVPPGYAEAESGAARPVTSDEMGPHVDRAVAAEEEQQTWSDRRL